MSIQSQGLKSSIVSYVGILFGYINLMLLFPLIFTPRQFGLTQILIAISLVFAQFAQLGVPSTVVKFFPHFRDPKNKHRGFLFFALIVPFTGFLIFLTLFFIFRDWIVGAYSEESQMVVEYYYLIVPMAFFMIYSNVLDYYARSLYSIAIPTFIREVLLRLFVMAFIGLFYAEWIPFEIFIWLFAGAYALEMLVLLAYIIKLKQWLIKPDLELFKRKFFRYMLVYGMFAGMSSGAWMFVSKIDIIMIGAFNGLADTAIYTVAFFIATIIQLPQRSISKIAVPIVSEAWKDRDMQKLNYLYRSSSINMFIIGLLLFIGIWINLSDIFHWMPRTHHYDNGYYVILYFGLARLFDMATGISSEILATSRHYKFDLYFIVALMALSVVTNLIFIPLLGIEGAALASTISIVIYNLLKYGFLYKKYKLQPLSIDLLKIAGIGLLVIAVAYILPLTGIRLADVAIRSILITLIFSSLILYFNLSEEITSKFEAIKIRLLNK